MAVHNDPILCWGLFLRSCQPANLLYKDEEAPFLNIPPECFAAV